jgi:Tol biopolymer transport system component
LKLVPTLLALLAIISIAPCADAHPFHYVTHPKGFVDYWPRWSPDGETILFSRCLITSGCAGGAVKGTWDLFTVHAEGGPATQFAQIDGVSATRSNWLWNPNVDMPIAFTGVKSGPSGENGVYLVGPDGSNATRLPTDTSIPNGYPSWFPDGSALTVEGMALTSEPFIDLIGVPDGTLLQAQTSTDQIWTGQSAISRDGSMLAFAGQMPKAGSHYSDDLNQIWLQALIPQNPPSNFDTDLHQLDPLQGRTPDWSPNDRFISFESTRGCHDGNYAIFIEAAVGGKAVQITDCNLNANHAVWSPDGRLIAFSAEYFTPKVSCSMGCRGIVIAPVPEKILRLGTGD